MVETVTFEQVAALAAQLPPQEQLALLASISQRLSSTLHVVTGEEKKEEEQQRAERLRVAEELLAEVQDIEDDAEGEFDSAETLRQLREERIAQICRTGA